MFYLKKYYGQCILAVLALLPAALWLQAVGVADLIESPGRFVAGLGKLGALSGLALFALMPVLSMRHSFINTLFGGIDNAYRLHKTGGKLSFFLILAHPVFLGLGRSLQGAGFTQIWDWTSLLILSGIAALGVFAVVTGVSVYAHIKHQRWVWVHRMFGWLMPVFFVHALLARSVMVDIKPLFVYFLAVGCVGFGAFMYRSVFYKYVVKRYKYVVSEVNQLGEKVVEVVLKPLAVPLTFVPGQFAYVAFDAAGMDTEAHPFSMSNSNNGPYIRFTIKSLGDDTAAIHNVKPGTNVLLEGPYGQFSYRRVKNTRQVWIAGGIGITPFLSMARSFSGKKEYDIHFFYGTESLEEAVFLQEFMDITRHLPANFRTSVVSKNISGFVSVDLIKKSLGEDNYRHFDYLICGPPGMMKALLTQLSEAGVPEEQIHIESFDM